MKPLVIALIVVVLFAAGVGGGLFFLTQTESEEGPAVESEPAAESTLVENQTPAHGKFPAIPSGAKMCSDHRVPEMVCPFHNPDGVDEFGFCKGHDVPEAHCTRCHPILIAAYKAEGDWCAEHGVPESQCTICNPPEQG